MYSPSHNGKERYHFGLSNSFKGFGVDKKRRIRGWYPMEPTDVAVRMTVRFHHLQMKWSLHILKNFWYKRLRQRREFSLDYPVPAEVHLALSWVIGQDLMTCTDQQVRDLLSRAFVLDEIDGYFSYNSREAPFCIGDFVNKTYFRVPLLRDPPLREEKCEHLGEHPAEILDEDDRTAFRRIHFLE